VDDLLPARRLGTVSKNRPEPFEDVGATTRYRWAHVIEFAEFIQRALEIGKAETATDSSLATHAFQVSLLRWRNGLGVPATILDGRLLAATLRTELLAQTSALRDAGTHPRLAVVFVGHDESSEAYVRNLERTASHIGIDFVVDELDERAGVDAVRARLDRLRDDPSVHGVLLQQPLPPHLSIREIADAIPVNKDVDGAHPINQGHLAFGAGTEFVPATPAAVMLLLERSPHWPLRGRRAAVIGRSIVVGAPVAMLLLACDATVTILHKESGGLQPYTKLADVIVIATGVPGLLTGDDVKPGATVIDVGTTVVDGVLLGDVDFDSVVQVAGALTPVPGGVGPVTNIALLRNVVKAAWKFGPKQA
jgi:methylenetetrahydrofolate dehydrogenase (NADP+)/methenyltetrahydrofolate cyclohydrolase